jgi:two-component system, NarL family, nitrate/nitrite response regulator NarL
VATTNVAKQPIRVLMIGDHALFCESLARALSGEPDLNVEHATSIRDTMLPLSQRSFDMVLLDYDLGMDRASEFLGAARKIGYTGSVLVVSAWLSQPAARLLLKQGVNGIFVKHHGLTQLVTAIRTVSAGGFWIDSSFTQLSSDISASTLAGAALFTELERKVQQLILEGFSNKEIGQQMQISESYVKAIVQRLFQKTGVRTRGQLVRLAIEQYKSQL